ncbi:YihY/virulence factor BrkB family protein [Solicola gregarius]|uniref:YihY/virulence factor BrkB family protein n=1 Tax=Solicola gregarius TaxID=2908642 RepID=A0AA46TKQ8_9ACTN|nr:YihY/virulence factor BrkB family protein [Solicola gregarius]UYM06709.1 YihY/virulence factor BrkB family protein [Solicola gregarius]
MSTLTERIDGFQRRHAVLGYPIAVIYKFGDDQGNYLAAMITYYAFIAIFPLLLLGTSLLGLFLQGDDALRDEIFNSALGQFPVIGDRLAQPDELSGSTASVTIGLLVALYGSLGVAQAGQHAINVAWAVPRNARPNPIVSRLKSVVLLLIAGLALLATAIGSTFARNSDVLGGPIGSMPGWVIPVATTVLFASIFTALFRLASAYDHRLRSAAPGAIAVAVAWHFLQQVGEIYVREVLQGASEVNGTFALVLGLIGLIYIGAFIVVFGIEINVVLAKRLYPRALLTPFTDNVDLTEADKRAYAGYVRAQRHKGYELVDVRFDRRTPRSEATRSEPAEDVPAEDVPAEDVPAEDVPAKGTRLDDDPVDLEPEATLEVPADPNGFAGRGEDAWTDD